LAEADGERVDCLLQVAHVCLVLVCADFNPHLYSSLSQILLNQFIETSSPITVLEVFLELMTRGQCHSVNNGTISIHDFDVKHWALSQARVKGLHPAFANQILAGQINDDLCEIW